MKIGDKINLRILDTGMNGEGVARYKDYVVFVDFALKGETVVAAVQKIKANIIFAKTVEVINSSPNRVTPVCPHFQKCGGCDLMHVCYDAQLEIKTNSVKNTLMKQLGVGHEVKKCKASENPLMYRNKVEFPVFGEKIGFYQKASHKIEEVEKCYLCDEWCDKFLHIARKCLKNNRFIKHIVARRIVDNSVDNICVTLVTTYTSVINVEMWITMLISEFPHVTIYQNINPNNTSEVFGKKFICRYGKDVQRVVANDICYDVSPGAFLQVNEDIQNKIYTQVLENIDNADFVINAYSGAGFLSALLSKKCKKLIGIEINESATKDADKLMAQNNIKNVENICGGCGKVLNNVVARLPNGVSVDFVIDPPRKGVDKKVISAILEARPDKIIYISCNPATLARDLKQLTLSYKISLIQPYDMFPQTRHVETLVVLKKK